MFVNGTFSDPVAAAALNLTLNTTCDEFCWKRGSNWSLIYAYGAMVNLLMAMNGLLIVLGGWFYKPRIVGIFCHWMLTIFLIASVSVTYTYRYSTMGKMAALSTLSVHNMTALNITLAEVAQNKTGSDLTVFPDERNYTDDAKLIDNMFTFQLIALIVCFLTANIGCFKVCNEKPTDS